MFLKNLLKITTKEFGINPLKWVSLSGYTYQWGLKYTDIILKTIQDRDLILTIGNIIRVGISSILGDEYEKPDDNKKILYIDASNLYGWAMSQSFPYGEIKFDGNVKLEKILNTSDDSDIGYFIEVGLKYPSIIKSKTKKFPFAAEI